MINIHLEWLLGQTTFSKYVRLGSLRVPSPRLSVLQCACLSPQCTIFEHSQMFYYLWTSLLSTFTSILVLSEPRFWNLQNILCWGNERHLCCGRQELIRERLIFAKPVQYPSNRILRGKKNENSKQSLLMSIDCLVPSIAFESIRWGLDVWAASHRVQRPYRHFETVITKTWGGCSKLMSL